MLGQKEIKTKHTGSRIKEPKPPCTTQTVDQKRESKREHSGPRNHKTSTKTPSPRLEERENHTRKKGTEILRGVGGGKEG